jgi:hypothetical protein
MTLKGEARTNYMREYMRRRRAGETAKGVKPVKPSPAPDAAKDARIRELELEAGSSGAQAEPDLRSFLSMSAQQKFDAAIRQYQRQLAMQFEKLVLDEVKRRIDEIILPHWKEKISTAEQLYKRRKGAMDKKTFETIRRALHPDSRKSISDHRLGLAFNTFMGLEKFLLDEKESPTDFSGIPDSWDEWEKMKRDATAERRARRASGKSSALRRR